MFRCEAVIPSMPSHLQPYPVYRSSSVEWLGDMPAHWEVVQLGRIGRFSKGSGGTKADEVSEGVPCIRYGDLYTSHKYHIRASRAFVTETDALNYTPIRYGDNLFAGSGETIEEIGKSAVNLIEQPACCGGDVILFRPEREIDARFSGYAIDCPQSQYQKSTMGRGITVMHIYGGELKNLWMALPPLPEQRRHRPLPRPRRPPHPALHPDQAKADRPCWRESATGCHHSERRCSLAGIDNSKCR